MMIPIFTFWDWMAFLFVFIIILAVLNLLSRKVCDICGAYMLEYDDKHDYCPNEFDAEHVEAKIKKI